MFRRHLTVSLIFKLDQISLIFATDSHRTKVMQPLQLWMLCAAIRGHFQQQHPRVSKTEKSVTVNVCLLFSFVADR